MERNTTEQGFGIVSVLVAMLLFGIILAAAAPVLVNALRQAADNAALAAASQLANDQVASARTAQGSCESFATFIATPTPNVTDSRGNEFVVTVTSEFLATQDVVACKSTPRSYKYEVSVSRAGTSGTPLVTTTTLLAVPGVG